MGVARAKFWIPMVLCSIVASAPITAASEIVWEAENTTAQHSGVNLTSGWGITGTNGGHWMKYANINLGTGYRTFDMWVARPAGDYDNGRVEVRLDSMHGPLLGYGYPQGTTGWGQADVQKQSFNLWNIGTGVRDVFVVFRAGYGVGSFDKFGFSSPGTEPIPSQQSDGPQPESISWRAADAHDWYWWKFRGGTLYLNVGSSTHVGVTDCDNGDWVEYRDVNLYDGYEQFDMMIARSGNSSSGFMEIRLDSITGMLLGSHYPTNTGGWFIENLQKQSFSLTAIGSGVRNVYVVFKGGWGVGNFHDFGFSSPAQDTDVEKNAVQPPPLRGSVSASVTAGREVAVNLSVPLSGMTRVGLFDGLGRCIYQREINTGEPVSRLAIMPTLSISSGHYVVQVSNGQHRSLASVIVR